MLLIFSSYPCVDMQCAGLYMLIYFYLSHCRSGILVRAIVNSMVLWVLGKRSSFVSRFLSIIESSSLQKHTPVVWFVISSGTNHKWDGGMQRIFPESTKLCKQRPQLRSTAFDKGTSHVKWCEGKYEVRTSRGSANLQINGFSKRSTISPSRNSLSSQLGRRSPNI